MAEQEYNVSLYIYIREEKELFKLNENVGTRTHDCQPAMNKFKARNQKRLFKWEMSEVVNALPGKQLEKMGETVQGLGQHQIAQEMVA